MSSEPEKFEISRDAIKASVMKKIFANPAVGELLKEPKSEGHFFLQLFNKLASEEFNAILTKLKDKDAEILILRGSLLQMETSASAMRAELFDAHQEIRRLHKKYRIGETALICQVCKSPNRDISKGPVCYSCDTSPLKFMRDTAIAKTETSVAAAASTHTSLQVETGSKRSLSIEDGLEDESFGPPRFQSTELPRAEPIARRDIFKTPRITARSETQDLFTEGSPYDSMSESQVGYPESESQDAFDESFTEDQTLNDIENDETEIPSPN